MKKILSLLTAITLTASGTSSVISCGSNTKTNAASKKAVDAIKAKIVKTTLSIQGGNINSDASKAINKPIIDLALRSENAVLSLDDLKQISYSGTLTPKSTKTIKATITIGSGVEKASTTIDLSITWNETNQEAANSFATSLKDKNISISFIQKNTDTKASAYVSDITTQLKTQVPGNYNIAFATTADGEKNLSTTDTSVDIKVIVNATESTVTASINIKFSDNSKVVKANNFATSLNGQSIEFMQQDSRNKVSDYNDTIKTELQKKVPGNYDIKLTQTEGNKTLTKSDIEVDVTVTFGGVDSTRTAKVNMKFSDNSNIVKANNFATSLNGKWIAFAQQASKDKVSDYTNTIKTELQKEVTGNYDIKITQTEGNKTLSKTNITIDIKAIVNSITSTTTATINVKFSDNSDIVKANNFVIDLNNKSIDFMQKNTDTKASAYVSDITTKLQDQVAGNYTFTFDGTDGNIDLTTTAQQIKIKIEVNGVSSTSSATINMKFTDNSDIVKANNFATQLNNSSLEIIKQNSKTKASDYTSEIETALKGKVAGNYNFIFDGSAGDTILSLTNKQVNIKIVFNSITSTTIAIVNIRLIDDSNKGRADSIVTTLKNQTLNPLAINIKFPVNQANPPSINHYDSEIQAKLSQYLTTRQKTYTYSLINTSTDPNPTASFISNNTNKEFDLKVKIGDDTSTDSFKIKIYFNYTKVNIFNNKQIISIDKKFGGNNTYLIGTKNNGLYILKNDLTVDNNIPGIPINAKITIIKDSPNYMYVGTTQGLYRSNSQAAIPTFTKVTAIGDKKINSIALLNNDLGSRVDLIVGTDNGLYQSNGGQSNFMKTSFPDNKKILSVEQHDVNNTNTYYIGVEGDGLYKTTDKGTTFSKVTTNNLDTSSPTIIKEVGTGVNAKIYVGTKLGLYISNNDLSTFTKVNDINDVEIHAITKIHNGNIYIGTDNGLYKTLDGTSFVNLNNQGMPNQPVYSISNSSSAGYELLIGTSDDLYLNLIF